jgi:exopolysaccharide biosynthesis predicted pyruvyltransferase EpsI
MLVQSGKKEHKVGMIPHNVDYEFIKKQYPDTFIIGLGTSDYKKVIHNITSCKKVISSSLHGVICAHAYGIPAAWVNPNRKLKGDDIKFKDYFESVGIFNYEKSTYEDPVYIEPGVIDLDPIIEIFEDCAKQQLIL